METNEALVAAFQSGEKEAAAALYEQNRGFIYSMARRVFGAASAGGSTVTDMDDLMQAAYPAVVYAAERFDPAAGASYLSLLAKTLSSAFAEATNTKTEKQRKDPLHNAASIDAPISPEDEDGDTLGDIIRPDDREPDQYEALEEDDYQRRLSETVRNELAQLPADAETVMRLRFFHGLTRRETGERLGLQAAEVKRIEERAEIRLSQNPRLMEYTDYLNRRERELSTYRLRLQRMKERAGAPRSAELRSTPIRGGWDVHRGEDLIIDIADMEQRIEDESAYLRELRKQIDGR